MRDARCVNNWSRRHGLRSPRSSKFQILIAPQLANALGIWSLRVLWNLELGLWNLKFGTWKLEFISVSIGVFRGYNIPVHAGLGFGSRSPKMARIETKFKGNSST